MMVLGLCHRCTHRGVTHPRWCVRRSSLLSLLSLCNQYGLSIRHRYAKSWFLETQMGCSTSVGTHYMHQGLAHELLTFQRWETRIFLMRSNANTFGDDFIDNFSFCFTILTLTTPKKIWRSRLSKTLLWLQSRGSQKHIGHTAAAVAEREGKAERDCNRHPD